MEQPVAWRLPNGTIVYNNGSAASEWLLGKKGSAVMIPSWYEGAVPLWFTKEAPATPEPTLTGAVIEDAHGLIAAKDEPSSGDWMALDDSASTLDWSDFVQPVKVHFAGIEVK